MESKVNRMSIDEIHEMAIRINECWNDLKYTKREFVYETDFYSMIESAYFFAKVGE
jgi:hypothetical protein